MRSRGGGTRSTTKRVLRENSVTAGCLLPRPLGAVAVLLPGWMTPSGPPLAPVHRGREYTQQTFFFSLLVHETLQSHTNNLPVTTHCLLALGRSRPPQTRARSFSGSRSALSRRNSIESSNQKPPFKDRRRGSRHLSEEAQQAKEQAQARARSGFPFLIKIAFGANTPYNFSPCRNSWSCQPVCLFTILAFPSFSGSISQR